MKFIWEKEDVVGGRVVLSEHCEDVFLISATDSTDLWMIVSVSDGYIMHQNSRLGLMNLLNEKCFRPRSLMFTPSEEAYFQKLREKFE